MTNRKNSPGNKGERGENLDLGIVPEEVRILPLIKFHENPKDFISIALESGVGGEKRFGRKEAGEHVLRRLELGGEDITFGSTRREIPLTIYGAEAPHTSQVSETEAWEVERFVIEVQLPSGGLLIKMPWQAADMKNCISILSSNDTSHQHKQNIVNFLCQNYPLPYLVATMLASDIPIEEIKNQTSQLTKEASVEIDSIARTLTQHESGVLKLNELREEKVRSQLELLNSLSKGFTKGKYFEDAKSGRVNVLLSLGKVTMVLGSHAEVLIRKAKRQGKSSGEIKATLAGLNSDLLNNIAASVIFLDIKFTQLRIQFQEQKRKATKNKLKK